MSNKENEPQFANQQSDIAKLRALQSKSHTLGESQVSDTSADLVGAKNRWIVYSPAGVFMLFYKLLEAASDNKSRDTDQCVMTKLDVTIGLDPDSITMKWNGAGLSSTGKHKEKGLFTPEIIFGHMRTSTNCNDDIKQTVGGAHGLGPQLHHININSIRFEVEIEDATEKKKYVQVWTDNMTKVSPPEITPYDGAENTTAITFYPDFSCFGMEETNCFPQEMIDLFHTRVKRIQATASKARNRLKVSLNGTPVAPIDSSASSDAASFKKTNDTTRNTKASTSTFDSLSQPSAAEHANELASRSSINAPSPRESAEEGEQQARKDERYLREKGKENAHQSQRSVAPPPVSKLIQKPTLLSRPPLAQITSSNVNINTHATAAAAVGGKLSSISSKLPLSSLKRPLESLFTSKKKILGSAIRVQKQQGAVEEDVDEEEEEDSDEPKQQTPPQPKQSSIQPTPLTALQPQPQFQPQPVPLPPVLPLPQSQLEFQPQLQPTHTPVPTPPQPKQKHKLLSPPSLPVSSSAAASISTLTPKSAPSLSSSSSSSPITIITPLSLLIKSDKSVIDPETPNTFRIDNQTYTILASSGRGTYGAVSQVTDKQGVSYALKDIPLKQPTGQKSWSVPDYESEAHILEMMGGNENVIKLLAWQPDLQSQHVYMLMEYGTCNLETHVDEIRHRDYLTPDSMLLPSIEVKRLWHDMLRCVKSVHDRNVIHNDLKPANFVLSTKGRLKLIDFGIAKVIPSGETSVPGNGTGTLNYMSPEAVMHGAGCQLSLSSDIWSLGCLLYFWTYGDYPFARFHNKRKQQALDPYQDVINAIQIETISFYQQITITEQVGLVKVGNGIKIELTFEECKITRTYKTLPQHLINVPLPHYSVRQVDPDVIDVLKSVLDRDGNKRPTAQQLLHHPYVNGDAKIAQTNKMHAEIARLTQLLKQQRQQL